MDEKYGETRRRTNIKNSRRVCSFFLSAFSASASADRTNERRTFSTREEERRDLVFQSDGFSLRSVGISHSARKRKKFSSSLCLRCLSPLLLGDPRPRELRAPTRRYFLFLLFLHTRRLGRKKSIYATSYSSLTRKLDKEFYWDTWPEEKKKETYFIQESSLSQAPTTSTTTFFTLWSQHTIYPSLLP